MLELTIPGSRDLYNEKTRKFLTIQSATIQLEHSLWAIAEWESKYKDPFLSRKEKTIEETVDYIRFMTVTPNVDPNLYLCLTTQNMKDVQEYLEDSRSALRFRGEEKNHGGTNKIKTSEHIYAAMAKLGIPFECDKWNFNRLVGLIHECELIGSESKMSRKDSAKYMQRMNSLRRAKHHTRG